MAIAWDDEVNKRKDAFLEDLKTLLRVKSVRDKEHATADAPLGPGPKEALTTFLGIAERDGFTTKNVDNVAGRIEYGDGDEILGIIAHVDVVPVDDEWKTDPFEPVVKDGILYARGSSDDKGPGMAAYYALKIIRDLGLPVHKKIHLILGTDEESDWEGVHHYFETEPLPDFGFSPDAEFPIINGEKGIYTVHLHFPRETEALRSFNGGQRVNMVPGQANAVVTGVDVAEAEKLAEAFNKDNPVTIRVTAADDAVQVTAHGLVSHGAQPENGHNAGTYLAAFLRQLSDDLKNDHFLTFVEERLLADHTGEKFGIAYHDDLTGDLSMNPGVFESTDDEFIARINSRVPEGRPFDELDGIIDKLGEEYHFTREADGSNEIPHYVSGDDPLVKTLLSVYEEHTGEKGYEQVIGGGTYGRMMERGVAFGAQFPGAKDTMHQPNEFEPLDTLYRAMAIYADAIYRLVQ